MNLQNFWHVLITSLKKSFTEVGFLGRTDHKFDNYIL